MIVKLYLPRDWSQEMYNEWLDWFQSRINEKEDLLLRLVEKIEIIKLDHRVIPDEDGGL